MEEMSPAVAVTFSLGNSICDNSGIATHVEITRLKLVTDAANLLLDPALLVSAESVSSGNGSSNDAKSIVNLVTMSTPEGSGREGVDLLPENGVNLIANDIMIQESGEDEILSIADDSNGFISEELLIADVSSQISLPDIREVENVDHAQIVAKAIILVEASIGQVPSGELIVAAMSPDLEISHKSDLKASTVVLHSHVQKSVSKGSTRSVFELDCIPLWGSVSVCGKRPEMEDAIAAVPRFMKIPIKMLIGDRVLDGMNQSLTHISSHFFAVYDGHGGSQVANYCCERIHLALAEEIGAITDDLSNVMIGENQQLHWEKAFTSCFQKVDDEVGGKVGRGIDESIRDTSDPVAPETVGSTAVVAVICSSHIIVANCGDSRAVLCRGKEPIALSTDHKPNREDEYSRIEAAGGKVIQWNGHRVFGVLAMSRSIGR
ncbi:protein phosphatase 2C 16-like isoform X2 [Carya illinoinensis]|uniref:protein phosphatase 2C 16-like isoform X2 n=1 Tax=Carya illinoinensis TaxID=32201 RepID=UPI001C721BB5|nr:protein phosphatase 2C 16-like isoform X2 [Carya illinoinensis]